jgi:hypothetical protein
MPTIVRETGQARTVVVERLRTVASVQKQHVPVKVVAPGPQGAAGPAGPAGPSGDGVVNKIAAQILSGHRMVRSINATEADYASADEESHGDDVLGMTFGAAIEGANVVVITDDEVTEPSWNWTPLEPLFLGINGLITQVAPNEGGGLAFSLVVGFATSATTARIRVETPIYF